MVKRWSPATLYLSTRTFVEDEERELYEDFCERLFENLNPCGSFENFLVDRIISTAWRLRRVVHIEALLFQKTKDFLYNDSYCEAFVGSSSTSMATLSRYERALERSFYRAIRELKEFRGQEEVEILTVNDGWVWLFTVEEHWNAECLGWHVCKKGDRFGALEPVTQAIKNVYGAISQGIAKGLKLRIDNGTQYTSDYFLEQIRYMGVEESFGLVR